MINFIINLIVSIAAHYFCRILDKLYMYLKNLIKEKWYTQFTLYMYLFFIFYISLIAFGISYIILIPVIYL